MFPVVTVHAGSGVRLGACNLRLPWQQQAWEFGAVPRLQQRDGMVQRSREAEKQRCRDARGNAEICGRAETAEGRPAAALSFFSEPQAPTCFPVSIGCQQAQSTVGTDLCHQFPPLLFTSILHCFFLRSFLMMDEPCPPPAHQPQLANALVASCHSPTVSRPLHHTLHSTQLPGAFLQNTIGRAKQPPSCRSGLCTSGSRRA